MIVIPKINIVIGMNGLTSTTTSYCDHEVPLLVSNKGIEFQSITRNKSGFNTSTSLEARQGKEKGYYKIYLISKESLAK